MKLTPEAERILREIKNNGRRRRVRAAIVSILEKEERPTPTAEWSAQYERGRMAGSQVPNRAARRGALAGPGTPSLRAREGSPSSRHQALGTSGKRG